MATDEIRLERLTRREFRQALDDGHFQVAILATGSIEQHNEHLALGQDIFSSTHVAELAARQLYPDVIVAVPISIGIAEHHMGFPGTLSAKPGAWLAVVFDAVESVMRHGVKKVLVLNGHGGNVAPARAAMNQWKLHLAQTQGHPLPTADGTNYATHGEFGEALLDRDDPGIDFRFHSYWDLVPKEFAQEVLDTGAFPGHAQEFETSFTMHAFPDNVRTDAIQFNKSKDPSLGTADKGRLILDKAIEGVVEVVHDMLGR